VRSLTPEGREDSRSADKEAHHGD